MKTGSFDELVSVQSKGDDESDLTRRGSDDRQRDRRIRRSGTDRPDSNESDRPKRRRGRP